MPEVIQNSLLHDLAVVMMVAAVVTALFHRFKQPVVLGYIIAGVIIGPHTPPFPLIQDQASIRTLADLGVILLMFTLGMQFSLRTLRQLGSTAIVAASVEIFTMVLVGYYLGRLFGWSKMDAIFLGAMLSITSTTITIKTLAELGRLKEKFSKLITGISLVEDMIGITLTAVLSGIAMTGALEIEAVTLTAGKAVVFLSTLLVVGLLLVPPLFRYIARFQSDETLLIVALGLCFGVSMLALSLGFSIALGAFVIGVIVAEAREVGKLRILTEPLRDMFIAVFFVSVGLMIDPQLLMKYAVPTLIVSVAVVVGKMTSFTAGTFLAGNDIRTSLRVGTSLLPIGELSLIIAALGVSLGVTSDFLYPIAVSVSAVTTLLTPYLIKGSDPVVEWFGRAAPRRLTAALELYSAWVDRFRQQRRDSPARKLAHKWMWQMALNVILSSGAFMAAAAVADRAEKWWPGAPSVLGGASGMVWLVAVVVALPSLIATVRKWQAFAMLLAESSVTQPIAGRSITAIRAIVSNTVFFGGIVGLGLWVLLLSATLLPGGWAMAALLLIVSAVTITLWRVFIQIHAKAQVAVRETLLQPPLPPAEPAATPVPLLLGEIKLHRVVITPESPAAGKLIRELELRTKTGASAVCIERADASIINPGPDDELRVGDAVLLLGNEQQLAEARRWLAG